MQNIKSGNPWIMNNTTYFLSTKHAWNCGKHMQQEDIRTSVCKKEIGENTSSKRIFALGVHEGGERERERDLVMKHGQHG